MGEYRPRAVTWEKYCGDGEFWGWREDGLIDGAHWVAPENYCALRSPSINGGVSAHWGIWRTPWKSSRNEGVRHPSVRHTSEGRPAHREHSNSRQGPNGNGVLHGFCESRSRIRKIIQAFFFLNFKRRVNELRLIYILKRPLVMYACSNTKLCMTPAERFVCVLQNYKASWQLL